MENVKEKIPAKISYKYIWSIAYPILISVMMEQVIGLTDTAYLGRVGEIELGAAALGGVFYITIFMIGLGFSIGAQILMGRRNGQGKFDRIGNIFYHSLGFLLLLAVVMYTGTRLLAPTVLGNIISSERVFHATLEYINWRILGFFFSFVCIMFRAFYVATTQTRTLTLNSLVMVGCNVVLNYVLIFGKFGLPQMGIAGAALASALSEGVSMVFFILYTRFHTDYKRYALNVMPKIRLGMLGHILGVSVWTMLQNFLSLATWFIFFLAVEHLGEEQLAVTNIVRNVSSVVFMAVISLSSTASTLVSNLMGEKRFDDIKPMLFRVIRLGYFVALPLVALFCIFPTYVLNVYTNNEQLIQASVLSLMVMSSSYIIQVPSNIYFSAVQGSGNTRVALVLELSSLVVYLLYIYVVILRMRVDVSLCWLSEHIYYMLIWILCYSYLRWGNWKAKRI